MNCTNCGSPLPEGAMFCTNCGARFVQQENQSAFQQPNVQGSGGYPQTQGLNAQQVYPQAPTQQPLHGGIPQAPQGDYSQLSPQGVIPQAPQGDYSQMPTQGGFSQSPQGGFTQAPQGGFSQMPAQGGFPQSPQGGFPQTPQDGFSQMPPQGGFPQTPQANYPQPAYPSYLSESQPLYPGSEGTGALKPKKSKKWIIPVIALFVVAAVLVTIQIVYTSRPAYKVRKAVEKTFAPAGMFEKLCDGDFFGNGSGTVEADFSLSTGKDVDSYMGMQLEGSDKIAIDVKAVSDADSRKIRTDFNINIPALNLKTAVSLMIDPDKVVLSCPEILSENLVFTYKDSKDGAIKDFLDKNYDVLRISLGELSKSGTTAVELKKAFDKVIDEFWNALNEAGFIRLEEDELSEGETGYKVEVGAGQATAFIDKAIDIATESLKKTETYQSIDKILECLGERKDLEDYINEFSDEMHKKAEKTNDKAIIQFAIKNGTISNFFVKMEYSSEKEIEFIGKEGDYPLQNCSFFRNRRGFSVKGRTKSDGTDKCSVYSAYMNSRGTIEEDEELGSWSYNKETNELNVAIGNVSGGTHLNNSSATSFDGVEIKAGITDESGRKQIKFEKISLFRNYSEVLNLEGTIGISGESAVSDITGNNRELNGASTDDLLDIFSGVGSSFGLDSLLGSGGLGNLFSSRGGYGYNDYNYEYGYDDYDYYDDDDYGDYDDYDYGDYDDYDYGEYDFGDYDLGDYDLGDFDPGDLGDLYSGLGNLYGDGDNNFDFGDLFS
ncbi:MAG: zinc-ribbon domain-containing protein [Lachnospiraceae bacterium]|nr:zinc-ribbon domain-containing protein [Lachnospiraceae bacterium]